MIKAIIIDDKVKDTEFLKKLILDNCKTIEIAGIADNIITATQLIEKVKPDLIFLDINILTKNEFLFFDTDNNVSFDIILTADIDISSFLSHKISAIHCLEKPVKTDELIEALTRYFYKMETGLLLAKNNTLQNQLYMLSNNKPQITFLKNGFNVVKFREDIIHVKANTNYSDVYFINDKGIYQECQPLGKYALILTQKYFLRIHRSNLINLNHVIGFSLGARDVTMIGDKELEISKSYRKDFLNRFNNK